MTALAEPIPASTVVLLRPGRDGPEVLLGQRPSTMAFAADMHVFPGGRVDAGDADPRLLARCVLPATAAAEALGGDLTPVAAVAACIAAIRESFEEAGVLLADGPPGGAGPDAAQLAAARHELLRGAVSFADLAERLDLRLRTDRLVPFSRWVTPPTLPRRFEARFFVAAVPVDAEATIAGDEVLAHRWQTPRAALDSMAAGEIGLWLPTSSTLQQLEHARSIDEVRDRAAPGPLGEVMVEPVAAEVVRVRMPAGGGVAGQPVDAYLVGRSVFVLVDPGDPTGPGLDAALEQVALRGGRLAGVVLTHVDPDHAAGAEALAEQTGAPVLGAGQRAGDLPYPLTRLADGDVVDLGDVPIRVVATPGPAVDHLAFVVGGGELVLTGDLDGVRGARAITGPADLAAWTRSVGRLRTLAPGARWLGGHPAPNAGEPD